MGHPYDEQASLGRSRHGVEELQKLLALKDELGPAGVDRFREFLFSSIFSKIN